MNFNLQAYSLLLPSPTNNKNKYVFYIDIPPRMCEAIHYCCRNMIIHIDRGEFMDSVMELFRRNRSYKDVIGCARTFCMNEIIGEDILYIPEHEFERQSIDRITTGILNTFDGLIVMFIELFFEHAIPACEIPIYFLDYNGDTDVITLSTRPDRIRRKV